MKDDMYLDLKIQGFGEGDGGVYQTIDIMGHGTIRNHTECTHFQTDGISQVKGYLDTETANIRGMATILGDFTADDIRIFGKSDVKGNINNNFIQVDGDLSVRGSCVTKDFINKGTVRCGDYLQAEKVAIKMYGKCQIKEIHAEKIAVERAHKNNNVMQGVFNIIKSKLHIDLIEGEDLFLEDTIAEVVRGENVTIGRGCEIKLVEYRNTFEKDADARVQDTTHLF